MYTVVTILFLLSMLGNGTELPLVDMAWVITTPANIGEMRNSLSPGPTADAASSI